MSMIEVPANSISTERFLPALQAASGSLRVPTNSPSCSRKERRVASPPRKAIISVGQGPPVGPHFTLITSIKATAPNTATLGSGLQHKNWGVWGVGGLCTNMQSIASKERNQRGKNQVTDRKWFNEAQENQ